MIGFHGKNIMNGKRTGKSMKTKPSGQFNPSIKSLLSFILSISILLTVAAPFAEPQTIEANWVTRTIGALITSLALQSGAANIDTNYLNYMNDTNNTVMQIEIPNDGGVTSLPADLASQIDTAIQTAPQSVQRTVQQFQTTDADVAIMNHALNEAGSNPSELNLTSATAGQNIAASAQELQNTGNVNPSFGGQAFGALQGIISGGAQTILGQKIRESVRLTRSIDDIEYVKGLYDNGQIDETQYANWMSGKVDTAALKTISAGQSLNISNSKLNYIIPGGNTASLTYVYGSNLQFNDEHIYSCPAGVYPWLIKNSTGTYATMVTNTNNYSVNFVDILNGRATQYSINARSNWDRRLSISNGDTGLRNNTFPIYNYDVSQNILNGTTTPDYNNKSPSLVGNNGQLTANYNINPDLNINYYTTNEAPIYNYNNYNMEPVDLDEYTQFAQSIQQQIGNDTPQAEISEAVEEYVSQHLVSAPIPTVAPPPPVVPEQPSPSTKPSNTPEQEAENMEIMGTPELKDKFPFCIPWDIYFAFALLEDEREAPVFDFELDLGPAGSYHIVIDFSEWDDIAALIRTLELLAFIIGLAIATKHLMGGTGA